MSKRNSLHDHSQASIASDIEDLVDVLARTNGPVICHTKNGERRATKLARHFDHIEQMVALFDGDYEYDYGPELQVFKAALHDLRVERSPRGLVSFDADLGRHNSTDDTLNALADRIRLLATCREYRSKGAKCRYAYRRNSMRYEQYADRLLDIYARTLIVRVDLYYRSEAQARLRVEQVFDDLQRLIRARERDPIFEHEIGYVVGVEQGQDRGYHIHLAVFFDGAKVHRDVYKGRQLGELWQQITLGKGTYNNCNQKKEEKYRERLGIGLVHRCDERKRKNALYAIRYLVKDAQYLSLKPKGSKPIRKGLRRA